MKAAYAIALALACAACSQRHAPSEEIVQVAEQIVDPAAAAPPPPLAKGRYAPRDACGEIEGSAAFRGQLAAVIEARDTEGLAALAADDIQLDFGGGSGTAQLRRQLEDPSGALWDDLDQLMTLGCAENGQGGITLPWIFEQDLDLVDPGKVMLVTGEDVPVRPRPDRSAWITKTISWDLVGIAGLEPDAAFQKVSLPDGTIGYLPSGRLRSLLDYRLVASSRNGRWRITSLIAGD